MKRICKVSLEVLGQQRLPVTLESREIDGRKFRDIVDIVLVKANGAAARSGAKAVYGGNTPYHIEYGVAHDGLPQLMYVARPEDHLNGHLSLAGQHGSLRLVLTSNPSP